MSASLSSGSGECILGRLQGQKPLLPLINLRMNLRCSISASFHSDWSQTSTPCSMDGPINALKTWIAMWVGTLPCFMPKFLAALMHFLTRPRMILLCSSYAAILVVCTEVYAKVTVPLNLLSRWCQSRLGLGIHWCQGSQLVQIPLYTLVLTSLIWNLHRFAYSATMSARACRSLSERASIIKSSA